MDLITLSNPGTNRPGIGSRIYIAEVAHIATFGAFVSPVVTPGDELRISGNHTFVSGKGFVTWETEDDIAQLMAPITGSRSSLGLKPELNIFLPGLEPERAWAAYQNKSLIVLIDAFGCNSTRRIQIGDQCNPARLMPSDGFKSGVAGGNDPRGWTLKIGSNYAFYFYEGTITAYPPPEEE
jgi:hypothetical protein